MRHLFLAVSLKATEISVYWHFFRHTVYALDFVKSSGDSHDDKRRDIGESRSIMSGMGTSCGNGSLFLASYLAAKYGARHRQ